MQRPILYCMTDKHAKQAPAHERYTVNATESELMIV